MAWFDAYNGSAVLKKPTYLRNSEIPLFIPMKMLSIKPYTTSVSESHQINALLGTDEVFFYLNEHDHKRVIQFDMVEKLSAEIQNQRNPFAVMARLKSCLTCLFLPFDVEMVAKYREKKMLSFNELPPAAQSDIDKEGLAKIGIRLE